MNKLLHCLSTLVLIVLISETGSAAMPLDGGGGQKKTQEGRVAVESIPETRSRTQRASWVLHGKVIDENNIPLPGASVIVIGTNRGVVTDVDGKFMIEILTENDSLAVSFVGYRTQRLKAGNSRNMTIKLEPDEEQNKLNEVTVVGYGTQKKISVTGAVSSISVESIKQSSTPSLSNAISGKLPGIITRQSIGEPGYDAAQVFIRGMSTWVQSAPLILVDGVERDMNNINAQEIESFTILKDASATAVYGVRGANGVVLINTKRGKIGKPEITFRTELAQLTALRMPEYINSEQYAALMNEARSFAGLAPRWTDEEIEKFKTGSDPYFYPNVNWTDVVLKKNTGQTINNLSVSGGNDFIRYYTNVGYTMQEGIYREAKEVPYPTNAKLNRYNFRSNVDIDLSKSLSMQLGLGGIIQNGNYPGGGSSYDLFHALRIVPPIAFPAMNPDGLPAGSPAYPANGFHHNPWGMSAYSGYTTQDRSTLQGTFGTRWDLSSWLKGMSIAGKFSYDRYNQTDNIRNKVYRVQQYTGKNYAGEDEYNLIKEERPMGYVINNNNNRAIYTELQLNYGNTFDKHSVSGMLLYNQRDFKNLNAGTSLGNLSFRQQGISGRTTYNYDSRYLAEFNFGYNGSENFAKGRRFGFFPSVSAGWIVSGEDFWHVPFVSNLKLRGSYGKVGNDQVGGPRFLYLTTVNTNSLPYRFGENQITWTGIGEDITGNANVTWETALKTNIGLDLEMLDGKISLQIDAFKEKRSGILMQRAIVPDVTGIPPWALPWANIGKVNNQGIDGVLELKNTTSSGLYYSIRGNFTYAHNEVVENDEPSVKYPYQSLKGKPIGQELALIADGFYQSIEEVQQGPLSSYRENLRPGDIKYRDVNGDGVINSYDKVAVGYPRVPEITFGFGGTTAYKNFDVSLYFTGAARTSIFLDGWSIWPFYEGEGTNNVLREYYDNRWTPDNTNAKYPAIDIGNNPNNFNRSTNGMRNASFLRLKNAEVGYTFARSAIKKIGVSDLRVFVNGMNLYTWDNVKIIDPESDNGTGNYPLQRNLNFGLQVNFK